MNTKYPILQIQQFLLTLFLVLSFYTLIFGSFNSSETSIKCYFYIFMSTGILLTFMTLIRFRNIQEDENQFDYTPFLYLYLGVMFLVVFPSESILQWSFKPERNFEIFSKIATFLVALFAMNEVALMLNRKF